MRPTHLHASDIIGSLLNAYHTQFEQDLSYQFRHSDIATCMEL